MNQSGEQEADCANSSARYSFCKSEACSLHSTLLYHTLDLTCVDSSSILCDHSNLLRGCMYILLRARCCTSPCQTASLQLLWDCCWRLRLCALGTVPNWRS